METPIATESLVLGRLLARHARYRPAHTAVVVPTGEGRVTRYSSREWDRYVNRLANALTALGVRSGDRVATLLPNRVELLATYWTCARLGAAVVPLSPLLTVVGLVSLLDDAEPAVVIAPRDQIAMLEEVRRRAAIGSRCRWVLVDATEGDAAGFDAFDALHAAASDVAPEVTVSAGDIAVIAPYAAQVRRLRELLPVPGLEIDSVDGFQGREKEAVVLSLVRSNVEGEIGFLADLRRTNVALTRARRKLLVIGDSATLAVLPFYGRLFDYFEAIGAYHTVWEEEP